MKFAIIGAGVAGLSAANYLVDKGYVPYLIDADVPGNPKVCGEFFSPEVIQQLEQWGVPLSYKHRAVIHTQQKEFVFQFDKPVASVSRMIIEKHLAQRAANHGAILLFKNKVADLVPPAITGDTYTLNLIEQTENRTTIEADRVIVAAGRFFSAKKQQAVPKKLLYIGIKGYFSNIQMPHDELFMFSSEQGYAGMSVSEEGNDEKSSTISFCCLADADAVDAAGGPEAFINQFIDSFDKLKELFKDATNRYGWIIVPVYSFGPKELPEWSQAYFCGDAAAAIYPASGNGLAMGMTSAQMAIEYAIAGDDVGYREAWHARYAKRLQYAKVMHYLFMHPSIANIGFSFTHFFPQIAQKLYNFTRD